MNFSLNNFITKLAISIIALIGIGHYCYKEFSATTKAPIIQVVDDKPDSYAITIKNNSLERRSSILAKIVSSNSPSVTTERSIAIFENGTTIYVTEPTRDHVATATVKLHRLGEDKIKFSIFEVEGGCYIISFSTEGVLQWVYPQEVDYIKELENDELKKYLTAKELKLLPTNWNPTLKGRIGLMARAWLINDLHNPKVHKILKGIISAEPSKPELR